MITLSESAREELSALLAAESAPGTALRVVLLPGVCGGPRLGLSLDQADEDDVLESVGGIPFCLARGLADRLIGLRVESGSGGLVLIPELPERI